MTTAPTLDTFARTLWAEARSQGVAGMEAVASVILNRAKNPRWWGHDIFSVCHAPEQFSCWNASDPQYHAIRTVSLASADYRLAVSVAQRAMAGGLIDKTGGADSYANLATCSPTWAVGAVRPCAVIGAHTFYRLELPAPPPVVAAKVPPGSAPQPAKAAAAVLHPAAPKPAVAKAAGPDAADLNAAELGKIEKDDDEA